MTGKTDFTEQQWEAIRSATHLVALATATAGNSGLFGSISESMASASAIAEAIRGDDSLLRETFDKEEIRAAQKSLMEMLKSVTDKSALSANLQKAAAETTLAALAALNDKGAMREAEAYKAFLKGVADKVASASKEGGFLGFGGERISDGEREFLAALDRALGSVSA